MELKEAWEILTKNCKEDGEYAWNLHCNLSVPIMDEGIKWKEANLAASRIMAIWFRVDTKTRFFEEVARGVK